MTEIRLYKVRPDGVIEFPQDLRRVTPSISWKGQNVTLPDNRSLETFYAIAKKEKRTKEGISEDVALSVIALNQDIARMEKASNHGYTGPLRFAELMNDDNNSNSFESSSL